MTPAKLIHDAKNMSGEYAAIAAQQGRHEQSREFAAIATELSLLMIRAVNALALSSMAAPNRPTPEEKT